nr:uncharacterized protein LOC111511277 [Leptinotarsa decemlineata]
MNPYRPPPKQQFTQNAQSGGLNTRETPNLYEQSNIPLNASSLYQSLNPGSINQELGAFQFLQNVRDVSNVQNTQQHMIKGTLSPKTQKGEVQLVYVPLENLKPNQPITQDSQTVYKQIHPQRYDTIIPNQQVRLEAIENDFIQQALQAQRLQQQIQEGQPIFLQPTPIPTQTPTKKRKAHQPPLSVYIEGVKQADVGDVLDVLKDAKSIAVQDSIQADSPQIFIGPSSLSPPDGYTKFPLPYLNNINGNRVERKIDHLPFFVAPLSFKTPPGFSKIPLPSPHVGSVVISNKEDLHGKRSTPKQHHISQNKRGQITSSSTNTPLVDNVTPQAYFGQNFYNEGHFLAPKPELLHFTLDDIGDYRIPSSTYSPESFFAQYNSESKNPPTGMTKYDLDRELSSIGRLATTIRHTVGQKNEIESTTRNSIEGQLFPADVQQIKLPPETKPYSDNHYFDEIPSRNQQVYQTPTHSADHENKIKHFSKSNHKTRYEPIATTLDSSYNSEDSESPLVKIEPKVTSPSPIAHVSDVYTESDRNTPKVPDVSPLELAINEFELYQINSQLQEKPRPKSQYNPVFQLKSNTRNQHQENRNHYQQSKTEKPEYKFDPELHRFASTPASILRDSYDETTVRPANKSRRRGRPTKPTTTTTTSRPEKNSYTVLEEFTARQPSNADYSKITGHSQAHDQFRTPEYSKESEYSRESEFTAMKSSTPEYSSGTQDSHLPSQSKTSEYPRNPEYSRGPTFTAREPSKPEYSTETEEYRTPEQPRTPEFSKELEYSKGSVFPARNPPISQFSREPGFSRTPEQTRASQYSKEPEYSRLPEFSRAPGIQYATEIEEVPAHVRVLTTPTPTRGTTTNSQYQPQRDEVEAIPARVYSLNVNDNHQVYNGGVLSQNQHLDQTLMDQQILKGTVRQERPQYDANSNPNHYSEQADIQPLVHNRGQGLNYLENINENRDSNQVFGYDISLEDPSVRSLLKPNLLVPTTTDEASYSAPKYLPTTEEISSTSTTTTTTTTTTEKYQETTTRGRGRGRQRGGSRYDSQTTRRTVSRRRPTHSQRTTTESYSAETGGTRKVNSRQRFRTRGRVTPNAITERLSTTENEIHNSPTSEAAVQIATHPTGPQSYTNYEKSVDYKPNVEISENQHTLDAFSRRPIVEYENTATTSTPIIDYKISHKELHQNHVNQAATQHHTETQPEVVYKKEEEIPRETVRVRGRIRGRPKPTIITSTTEPITTKRTTTPTQVETEKEEEFYGFFRQPNFSSQPAFSAEETITTEKPRFHHDNYNSENSLAPRQFDNTNLDSTTLRFVGEIVPKYQTTSREVQVEPETEAPRPRIRGRIKAPQRTSHRGSYEDSRSQEQSTRRTNVIRSRGRTQFQLPDSLRKEKDEDDVVGGNYPPSFFQNKQQYTTRAPTFQITVDPYGEEESDQAPHPSIFRPNVVRPDEWHDASQYDAGDKGQTLGNVLETENNQPEENTQVTTSAQPIALPIKASTEDTTTATREETYRENIKAAEKIFETINNNFDKVDETTKKQLQQKRRRKGVWKLVKQRPVDHLAAAESQNYYSVLNSYQELQRTNAKNGIYQDDKSSSGFKNYQNSDYQENSQDGTIPDTTTAVAEKDKTATDAPSDDTSTVLTTEGAEQEIDITTRIPIETNNLSNTSVPEEGSFFDTIYEMFGISSKEKTASLTTIHSEAEEEEVTTSSTTNVSPTFPEEMTETPTSTDTQNVTDILVDTTTDQEVTTTTKPDLKNFEVEPWEMKAVRTSTSTEISHETEICYKGKCVKSRDKKKRL